MSILRLSHPSTISVSSPSISGSIVTRFTSSGLIRFSWLQNPRQRSARVDCTERRDLTCESSRRPRLNRRSTSIDVAISTVSILGYARSYHIPGIVRKSIAMRDRRGNDVRRSYHQAMGSATYSTSVLR